MIFSAGVVTQVTNCENGVVDYLDRLRERLAPAVTGYQKVFRRAAFA